MRIVKLDTPMKLMTKDNSTFPFHTEFFVKMNDSQDLIYCSLLDNFTIQYRPDEHLYNYIEQLSSEQKKATLTNFDNYIWGLSTYKEVYIKKDDNKEESTQVVLIKTDLSIK